MASLGGKVRPTSQGHEKRVFPWLLNHKNSGNTLWVSHAKARGWEDRGAFIPTHLGTTKSIHHSHHHHHNNNNNNSHDSYTTTAQTSLLSLLIMLNMKWSMILFAKCLLHHCCFLLYQYEGVYCNDFWVPNTNFITRIFGFFFSFFLSHYYVFIII